MKYFIFLYRHERFTRKYATRKIHTKPHPGLGWRIFHILTSEDVDDFTDIKFVCKIVFKFVGG